MRYLALYKKDNIIKGFKKIFFLNNIYIGAASIANPFDFNIAHEKIVGFC
jgi:hypothetical protein